ncbi:ribose-5-phosphate isomerase RpiA [Paenibacillus allorhizosphaerae]|uniref:Ribose-5-phosphate isomerase A n=1 Tax=Paenibacillus allorhizosphaerae TaxID=2849866 RepID=A0ABN7TYH6_9BACL|nr:ribose-5-phosphate isomerase RpiA [Paenibacillus allorhizosphaerae]CAG7657520.1 Ribose-5-phosphate isomerase A [Paenibacillus allorhizosphaerae]
MESKRVAAEKAVEYIRDGMVVGLGTGSTTYWAIQKLGQKVKSGLSINAVATSINSENLAKELGIPLISISKIEEIDITIDGADEVDDEWNLIKGGGGALLREKIVASFSNELIIVVDESKKVNRLGKFPLPVELVKFGYEVTQKKISKLGCVTKLRIVDNKPFITDNGNYIVDCDFGNIDHPKDLHTAINMIPGVVDNGLFIKIATKVIVGYQDGSIVDL